MEEKERLRRQKEFLIKFVYWLIWGSIGIIAIKSLGSVLLPFVLAFAVALLLAKPVSYVSEKTHMKRNVIALLAVIGFYFAVAILLYLFGSRALSLVQSVFAEITEFLTETLLPMAEKGFAWMEHITKGGNQEGRIATDSSDTLAHAEKVLSGVSDTVIDGVSGIAVWIPEACMNLLIMVIATVFMELEFPEMIQFLQRQIPERWKRVLREIKTDSAGTLGRCVLSYLLILGMTFGELTIGFLLLGVEGAVVIALIIAILDILPVLGTGTVLLPWTVIAFAAGNLRMGIGVLILYLVITVVRNIVEPKLVGRQMGLSPVVMLPCMIVGLKVFGVIGLFGIPFGVAFLKKLNDRGVIHLWKSEN